MLNGATDDFDGFCVREHAQLVGALTLWCGDKLVAEEVVQEAFIRAYRDWWRVSRMDAPGAWVRNVAMNLARSRFRRRQAERRAHQRLQQHTLPHASDSADAITVRQAVSALPANQRTAVVLRYFLDLSTAETARAMKRSPTAVTSLTHRAIAALREAFSDPGLAWDEEAQS